jgi:hypothetical protein
MGLGLPAQGPGEISFTKATTISSRVTRKLFNPAQHGIRVWVICILGFNMDEAQDAGSTQSEQF